MFTPPPPRILGIMVILLCGNVELFAASRTDGVREVDCMVQVGATWKSGACPASLPYCCHVTMSLVQAQVHGMGTDVVWIVDIPVASKVACDNWHGGYTMLNNDVVQIGPNLHRTFSPNTCQRKR